MEFEPVKANEWACSYDINHFIIFYSDIVNQLRISPPFTHFQASVLNSLSVCLTQLTQNAWTFILCFKVFSLCLEVEPSPNFLFFFFSYAYMKNEGQAHFLQRLDQVIIKNMQTNIRSWKSFFIKVSLARGYHPFFLDECRHLHYPLKWSLPMWHEDWSFNSLLLDNQDIMVKLLVVAPLDMQAIISKFSILEVLIAILWF